MSPGRGWIQLNDARKFRPRFRKVLRSSEVKRKIKPGRWIDRIQSDSLTIRNRGELRVSLGEREVSRAYQKCDIRRRQRQGGPQCFRRSFPVEIERELDFRANTQRFRKSRLKGKRAIGGVSRVGKMFIEICSVQLTGVHAFPYMSLGQACPGESEFGVDLDGALVSHQRFAHALFRIAIAVETPLEITLMRLDIFCPALFRHLHLRLDGCLRFGISAGELSA